MKFQEAALLSVRYCNEYKRLIERLMKWDEKKTLSENAAALKVTPAVAFKLSTKFHLERKRDPKRVPSNFKYSRNLSEKCKCGKACDGTLPGKLCGECFENQIPRPDVLIEASREYGGSLGKSLDTLALDAMRGKKK